MHLQNRRAIITGANRGLGREIARHFVREGASVLLTGRDAKLLDEVRAELAPLATSGARVETLAGDVSEETHCEEAVARLARLPGDALVLVNNAGVYGPKGAIEDVDMAEWAAAIRINLLGTVLMCHNVIPLMRQANYGKIINLSGGGATNPLPRISAYAASKAAVVRMNETLAEELKDAHVDVNAIAPGALNTRLLDEVLEAGPEKVGKDFYERSLKQKDKGGAPIEKGAELAVWLASAASDGITGRLISALWDRWEEFPKWREQMMQGDVYTLRRIVAKDRGLDWDK
jgi:NAD(P)-dependent dehydrogenase (short-subunit alcohol dehydrogenase family)